MDNSINNSLSGCNVVGESGKAPIQIRFETLISSHNQSSSDWYHDLCIDKSDASKIRRGLVIPTKEVRLKIAKYFGVDSTTIWDIDYKKWCELNDVVEDFWGKVSEVKKHE